MNDKIKKVILKVRSGSNLYGTNTPKSDTDYIGVFIPQDDYVIGLKSIDSFQENIIDKVNGKNTNKAVDCTYYSLQKFLSLCLEGTVNVVEILFANEDNIVEITEEGRELINNLRTCFISQKLIQNSYGYIKSLIRKIYNPVTVYYLKELRDILKDLTPQNNSHESIKLLENELLKLDYITDNKDCYIVNGIYYIYKTKTIYGVLLGIDSCISNHKKVTKPENYDKKSAHHLIRLYLQTIELINERKITYPIDNNRLLDIKTGKVNYKVFLQLHKSLQYICDELKKDINDIPSKPNYDEVENYCKKTLLKNLLTVS